MPKIIFVPPEPYNGDRVLPVSGKIQATGVYEIHHSLFATLKALPVNSVFWDAMQFLGGCGATLDVADDELTARLWSRVDFLDWIEANCQGPVIVQNVTQQYTSLTWRLGFVRQADHDQCRDWIQRTKMRGAFEFSLPEATVNEIQEWIRDNLDGDASVTRIGYGAAGGEVRIRVKIKDLTQAAAFKLRWYGEGR